MITLFDHTKRRTYGAVPGETRRHQHYFGGQATDFGFQYSGRAVPLHLICMFDTADPLWAIDWKLKWFPLCYGFGFGGQATAYRVHETTIEVLVPHKAEFDPDFPCSNYPTSYPAQKIVLRREAYDPNDPEDALMNSAFFGLNHVSERTLKQVAARLDEFGDWDDVDLAGQTREQYLREHPSEMPLLQGIPDSRCVYDQCPAYQRAGAMQIIAVHMGDELEGTSLWGTVGEMILLIFQMCGTCRTMFVSNQCT